jgi:hypothetical protein
MVTVVKKVAFYGQILAASGGFPANLMLELLRLVPQCSLARSYGSGGELGEVGGSSPVDFRHRVGVVPQCGRSAAAVAKTRCCVTQVKPRGGCTSC